MADRSDTTKTFGRTFARFFLLTTGIGFIVCPAAFGLSWLTLGRVSNELTAVLYALWFVPPMMALPVAWIASRQTMRTERQLAEAANTDALTQISQRSHFVERAECKLKELAATRTEAALLLIDIDHFKDLNETFGQHSGDAALRHVTAVLREGLRGDDLIGRFDGTQFAVLLSGLSKADSQSLARRLVKWVANRPLTHANAILELSASCGLVHTAQSSYELAELIRSAEQALAKARAKGRNRAIAHAA